MTGDTLPRVRLEDYRPPPFLVDRVDLDIRLEPEQTQVRARLKIRQNPARPHADTLVLNGEELKLAAITLDGMPLPRSDYVVSDRALTIADAPEVPFELELVTILNPSANTRLMGLYRSNGIYCTQCEAEGFRRITYFPDRPDVLSVYTTRIEARKTDAPVLLGNGNLVSAGDLPNADRHYTVWHDPHPKPAYLFALVGGELGAIRDEFTTMSGRRVALAIHIEPGKETRARYAMEALKRAMKWDETAFGREYDLDMFNIVAVSDFNMGAMENKGLNIFNDKYILASPETATDADYAHIEAVIAHEYFHNWTGNRITCRDWFQLCLKEGLTVFRDQEFTSDLRSRAVKRIADVRLLRNHQFVEDAGPLAHPVRPESYSEINNFYTATVYEKGAEIVRMLRLLIGPAAFRAGMDMFFARHDSTAATVEEFLACFEDASGRDLTQFRLWYSQAGTPHLAASTHFDPAKGRYEISLEQTCPATPGQPTKEAMTIPIAFGLVGADGSDLPAVASSNTPIRDGVIELNAGRQTIVFENLTERPVPSLLRGFSAPVRLDLQLSAEDRLFLARSDSDLFNRWQTAQQLTTTLLVEAQADLAAGRQPAFLDGLAEALATTAGDSSLDPAFRAQMLQPPSEATIAQEIGEDVDPDAIHAADSWLRESLGQRMSTTLEALYAAPAPEIYTPDPQSAARRALRNAALTLLTAVPTPEATARALDHYHSADNMTDRMAALSALTRHAAIEAESALEDFHRRHQDDPLVLDKWLALQAAIPRDDTVERVRKLMAHPAFSLSNPNRLRALIGAFAASNPTQFNRRDGQGYRLVGEVVLELDRRNPQVAARLLSAFKTWRVLEPVRRKKAQAELRRIADQDGLSRDVSDIVERSLGV